MAPRSSIQTTILLVAILIGRIADSSDSPTAWSVFDGADDAMVSKLIPWLRDTHLPLLEFPLRSRFVRIDTEELAERLKGSFGNQADGSTCNNTRMHSVTDLIVDPFPDSIYRFAICEYQHGNDGYVHARGEIVGGTSGTSRFGFTIGQHEKFHITILSNGKMFLIRPTLEDGYFVINELDSVKIDQNR